MHCDLTFILKSRLGSVHNSVYILILNIGNVKLLCSTFVFYHQVTQAPAAAAPPQEVAKPPVPAEHQILCDTYDGLLRRCSEKAGNSAVSIAAV